MSSENEHIDSQVLAAIIIEIERAEPFPAPDAARDSRVSEAMSAALRGALSASDDAGDCDHDNQNDYELPAALAHAAEFPKATTARDSRVSEAMSAALRGALSADDHDHDYKLTAALAHAAEFPKADTARDARVSEAMSAVMRGALSASDDAGDHDLDHDHDHDHKLPAVLAHASEFPKATTARDSRVLAAMREAVQSQETRLDTIRPWIYDGAVAAAGIFAAITIFLFASRAAKGPSDDPSVELTTKTVTADPVSPNSPNLNGDRPAFDPVARKERKTAETETEKQDNPRGLESAPHELVRKPAATAKDTPAFGTRVAIVTAKEKQADAVDVLVTELPTRADPDQPAFPAVTVDQPRQKPAAVEIADVPAAGSSEQDSRPPAELAQFFKDEPAFGAPAETTVVTVHVAQGEGEPPGESRAPRESLALPPAVLADEPRPEHLPFEIRDEFLSDEFLSEMGGRLVSRPAPPLIRGVRAGVLAPGSGVRGREFAPGPMLGFFWRPFELRRRYGVELELGLSELAAESGPESISLLTGSAYGLWHFVRGKTSALYLLGGAGILSEQAERGGDAGGAMIVNFDAGAGWQFKQRFDARVTYSRLPFSENVTDAVQVSLGYLF